VATDAMPSTASTAATQAIAHNARAHDALGSAYDSGHPEIFNAIEQARLGAAVRRAVALVGDRGRGARALDVGCGTGNLTAHLIAAGATVTAADLSSTLREVVRERFRASGQLDGVLALNGSDLRPIADGAYDVVATYSVLHHVPDYLALVRDMARVTAKGGIVMIDHERTEASWTSPEYARFLREAVVWPPRRWWYWLQPSRYWKRIKPMLEWRRWSNPRWMPEGDLHIWPDDHIEWSRVEAVLRDAGCEIVACEQYLLFEPRYQMAAWERWRERCSDMQLLIARKVA
jgi:2-polyprenyl-3-methyl-5-hydroxy-6-metoxy-1,4-benzoquinol methylase